MAESGCKTVKEVEDEADRLFAIVMNPGSRSSNEFVSGIESACDTVLVRLLARLPGQDVTRNWTDTVRATLDLRMSERQIAGMERLETSTSRLTWVAIGVTVVLAGLGLVFGM